MHSQIMRIYKLKTSTVVTIPWRIARDMNLKENDLVLVRQTTRRKIEITLLKRTTEAIYEAEQEEQNNK